MLGKSLVRFAVVLSLVVAARSQTFVVDASNGPGTDFTALDVAVAAVPDGATLIVRPGNYASAPMATIMVNGKGLTILGTSGVTIGSITFGGQNANQRVVLKNLQSGFLEALRFMGCLGPVHVEDCSVVFTGVPALAVEQCPQVSLVRCNFRGAGTTFTQSEVVAIDTTFWPSSGLTFLAAADGITITGGSAQLARCTVKGGPASTYAPTLPAGAGITMNGGTLRLLGPGSVQQGSGGPTSMPAIRGTGAVRATPSTSFVGGTIPFTVVDEGTTSSTNAPIGGVVTGKLEGFSNLFGGLVFGFPQPPQTFAGITEELWVDPLGFAISGSLATPLTFWLDVPNEPLLRGWMLGWQGVTLGAAGTVLANPAWFCLD